MNHVIERFLYITVFVFISVFIFMATKLPESYVLIQHNHVYSTTCTVKLQYFSAGLSGSMEFRRSWVDPHQVWQHSLVEIDHEIFSTVILSLLLIKEEQLSVSGKRMCTSTG